MFNLDTGVLSTAYPDNGTTTVTVPQGRYSVMGLVHSPESGYVSLRVKAWDAGGSRIEQTLIRAYAVR
ncbi:hypothetical protein [Streptomyces sp. NPDC091209]|uniref:hypothetical protein n=1 Tax=Streptomyces sp. NPDC091209 TaxID=3365974 RepID=UPI0037FB52C2